MKTTSEIIYTGQLRTEIKHTLSGQTFITDAPPDNQGKGEAISPTDMVATALGTCILTTIGIKSQFSDFEIDGATARITKHMASDPRRISEIVVELNFPPKNYSDKTKQIIENTAKHCPVAQSLHPNTKQTLIFNFL